MLRWSLVDSRLSDGTSYVGVIDVDYKKLKNTFGTPSKGDNYKVDAEWVLQFSDGVVATIYNYKDGINYLGREGLRKTQIKNWHVGGHDQRAYDNVLKALNYAD
jgi:hypothetical protein